MEPMNHARAMWGLSSLNLFASASTLVCCALPILLVTVGLGATVAALTSQFPIIVALGRHKEWFFAGSALLLLLSGWLLFKVHMPCPAETKVAMTCDRLQRWSRGVYWISASLWSFGFFTAYLLLPLRIRLGG